MIWISQILSTFTIVLKDLNKADHFGSLHQFLRRKTIDSPTEPKGLYQVPFHSKGNLIVVLADMSRKDQKRILNKSIRFLVECSFSCRKA